MFRTDSDGFFDGCEWFHFITVGNEDEIKIRGAESDQKREGDELGLGIDEYIASKVAQVIFLINTKFDGAGDLL